MIAQVTARAYRIPTEEPEADGTYAWDATTVVVVTVRDGDDTGVGWTYAPAPAAAVVGDLLAPVVTGTDPDDVPGTWRAMRRATRNAPTAGLVGYAISAVDVALWDLKARRHGLSLVRLLGRVRDAVPVYGSGGFTTYSDDRLREQLTGWAHEQRIPRVKIKIGESWGAAEDRDLHRIAVARDAIGPDTDLFVDANGGYSVKQAIRVARAAPEIRWFEEPVSSDDLAGLAAVRSAVDCDVAAGEYGTDPGYFHRMAPAVDCLQIDATRALGYTGFLRAAAVAEGAGLPVSAHCAPQLHAHVCAAVDGLRHIEWFADHVRIEAMLFDGVLDPGGGLVRPDPDAPGHGLTFKEADAERWAA